MSILELYEIFKQNPVITTDSRNCPENSLFFALKGERFNGNHYAKDTIKNGCSYAFVDEKEFVDGKKIIYVDNVLETLQKLANLHRKVLNTPIIGITGTNGKTTTKELIAAVLKKKYSTLYTQGNLNNHIGVPLTLLRLNESHEVAIIEMGANHPGEIKTLVEIVEPNYGIITNVGKAHIEGFGSFEGVIKTKCELYDFLEMNRGTVFVNKGNDILFAKTTNIEKVIEYGNYTEFSATIESNNPFLVLKWDDSTINTNLIGSYNAENIMASVAIGTSFNVDKKDIVDAIESYSPQNNRSQFKETAYNKLIIDAYNANPTSMNAAIDNFNLIEETGKMVILGDMKELGAISEIEHQKIIDKLENSNIEKVIVVGSEFKKTKSNHTIKLENINELITYLDNEIIKNNLILIKGSNSMKLIECINHL